MPKPCRCSSSFFLSVIGQGLILLLISFILFVYGSLYLTPAPAQVIAFGSAGTWLLVGYVFYVLLVIYLGMTTSLYHIMEEKVRTFQGNLYSWLTLGHFFFVNLGATGASLMLMLAGYTGGADLMSGLTEAQTHVQTLSVYPVPVAVFIGITMLGVFCGLLTYVIGMKKC